MNSLRETREKLGMTLEELAGKIGVHLTTVSEWELGKSSPRYENQVILSQVLGKSIDELFPPKDLPKATHEGTLKIGNQEINCAVLNNGKRIISERAVFNVFGRPARGKRDIGEAGEIGEIVYPAFMDAKNLRDYISDDDIQNIRRLEYISTTGKKGFGYEAIVIPVVCNVYLSARDSKALTPNQQPLAIMSDMIVRSLSKVAIVALIDEATGYQEERDRNELNKLLEKYLSAERLVWAKMFPKEFFKEIYRLKNWHYPNGNGNKHNSYVGKLINRIVYEKLPEGVLDALREKNPTDPIKKRRKSKHHQYLSPDIGQPDLRDHLLQVTALMRGSSDWTSFEKILDKAFPTSSSAQIELESNKEG